MKPENEHEIHMQGGRQKEPEKPPTPKHEEGIPARTPEPFKESVPSSPPDSIQPSKPWERE